MTITTIALDLDGTTIDRSGRISTATRAAIAAAQAKGVEVMLVSGRHHGAIRPYHAELGLSSPAICCNGTYLYDFGARRVLIGDPIPADAALRMLAVARAHGVHTLVYLDDAMTYEVANPHMRRFEAWAATCPAATRPLIRRVERFETEITAADAVWKLLISHDDPAVLAAWRAEAETLTEFGIEASWFDRVDVMKAGNTKGRRLTDWAASRGVDLATVVAIGDNHNDISMIEAAGLGVAMGNAEDALKAVAQTVTEDNDHDGVARAIERLVL